MNDRETFIKTWDWTHKNLTNQNNLFSWKWGMDVSDQEGVLDIGSATDADTDIATSLLFAYKRWGDQAFLDSAKAIIYAIWDSEVRAFSGKYYIVPGNWAKNKSTLIINPSYLAPSSYRMFAQVDPSHPWAELVNTSYEILTGCMTQPLFKNDIPVNLPPNWCEMSADGTFSESHEPGLESKDYSYDAIRTIFITKME
jgi:endoglucanase